MNALEKVRKVRESLESSGIEDADREAEMIVSHCLGTDRIYLYRDNPPVPDIVTREIDWLVKRRSAREPLQYVLGYTEFRGLKIKVGLGVLIPRPETELLAEEAVKAVKSKASGAAALPLHTSHLSALRILDLCTGSGCIALALANELPDAEVYGTDASGDAIGYARENARLNNIRNVIFLEGSLFEPLGKTFPSDATSVFDVITSNPPYIRGNDIQYLQPEIRDWEPAEALNGGEDGLDYYRIIIPGAKKYLKEGGYLILETGIGQSEEIEEMGREAGFSDITTVRDYAGIDRVIRLMQERV